MSEEEIVNRYRRVKRIGIALCVVLTLTIMLWSIDRALLINEKSYWINHMDQVYNDWYKEKRMLREKLENQNETISLLKKELRITQKVSLFFDEPKLKDRRIIVNASIVDGRGTLLESWFLEIPIEIEAKNYQYWMENGEFHIKFYESPKEERRDLLRDLTRADMWRMLTLENKTVSLEFRDLKVENLDYFGVIYNGFIDHLSLRKTYGSFMLVAENLHIKTETYYIKWVNGSSTRVKTGSTEIQVAYLKIESKLEGDKIRISIEAKGLVLPKQMSIWYELPQIRFNDLNINFEIPASEGE